MRKEYKHLHGFIQDFILEGDSLGEHDHWEYLRNCKRTLHVCITINILL